MTSTPFPNSLPASHRKFLSSAVELLQSDARIVGVAAGGSYISDTMDEFSDLDLVIAVEPTAFDDVMKERSEIAARLGQLVGAFTGEHVGEPRLLVCLYDGDPPLHVDLKFVALPDAKKRVEDPVIIWEREKKISRVLEEGVARYPSPNPQWIEDRFWIWMHYLAQKIGRGELFEVLDSLSFLRVNVFGPLILVRSDHRPAGTRRVEQNAPGYVQALSDTIAKHDATDCLRAVRASIDLYRSLRAEVADLKCNSAAEKVATGYLAEIERMAVRS
jgi:predicted nucleotidyltransferase